MTPFGDDARPLKLGAVLALLLAVGGYYAWIATTQVVGYRECVAERLDGKTLVFPIWDVTAIEAPDRYRISKVIKDVPIRGATAALEVGDTVSVMGTFSTADDVVTETAREVHVLRRWKEGLGVLGFVVMALLAPWAFALRGGRVVARG